MEIIAILALMGISFMAGGLVATRSAIKTIRDLGRKHGIDTMEAWPK